MPGPLHILQFINDILQDVPVKIKLLSDDCIIYSKADSTSDQLDKQSISKYRNMVHRLPNDHIFEKNFFYENY